jgi:arylsulfatase A-like enzyme
MHFNSRLSLIILIAIVLQADLSGAQVQKPNIIFILADDLGYGDLGCYGSTKIKTPNIDALAKGGVQFQRFYAGSTVCAPSRAALMTGQHTGHAGIRGNGEMPLAETDSILPQYLHKVGYTNGMVGKWGLGQATTTGAPEKKGWDFFAGLLHHVEGHRQKPDSAWQLIHGKSTKIKIPNGLYVNEWFTQSAKQFIVENKSNPFFLYVALTLPHAELNVPAKYLNRYLATNSTSMFAPEKLFTPGPKSTYGPQSFPKAAYAAMVTQMDDYVGQLVATLKSQKLLDNTIIIFTSDNGTHKEGGRTAADIEYFNSSGNLKGAKRDLYEGGIRVPFIVQWKGKLKAGTTNNHIAAFWDVLPTFCHIANTSKPIHTDGLSFLPTLKGKAQTAHDCLYWEFYEGGFKQAVVKNNWKAIRFYKGTEAIRTELYDLNADVAETNNVAAQQANITKSMEALMDREHIASTHSLFQIK